METNQARPLAYNLSKELNPKELDQVSGGGGFHICVEPSHFATNSGSTLDTSIDMRVDY